TSSTTRLRWWNSATIRDALTLWRPACARTCWSCTTFRRRLKQSLAELSDDWAQLRRFSRWRPRAGAGDTVLTASAAPHPPPAAGPHFRAPELSGGWVFRP